MSPLRNHAVSLAVLSTVTLVTMLANTSAGGRHSPAAAGSIAARATIDLKAIAVSVQEVNLAWRVPPNLPGITSMSIFRDGQIIASLPVSETEYIDTGVAAGNRYVYRLAAVNSAGIQLSVSNPKKVVTPMLVYPIDVWPPASPEDLTATSFPGYVLLDWYGANDDTDLTGYLIKRDGKRLVLVDSGTLEYRDTTAKAGRSYTYSVEAIDTMGNRSIPEIANVTFTGTSIGASGSLPPPLYLPLIANSEPLKGEEDAQPITASTYHSKLRRYPYLTDLVGPYVTINWATDSSNTSAFVTYGQVGSESCTAHSVAATRSSISINSVSVYQWAAMLTLLPDTRYCYRVYLGSSQPIDLLGSDPSPEFMTQLPAGSTKPFSFIVLGDWGDPDNGEPYQSALMGFIAQSGALFGLTTGDNAYSSGSQTNYGDLVETGPGVSGVFGSQGWGLPGRSMAMFPALGNHGMSNADTAGNTHLVNWPQARTASLSNGRYVSEYYGGIDGTTGRNYPSAWYAFDAGIARFYVLKAAWADTNTGNASGVYEVDYHYHWTPSSTQYQWLANDLATHPSALKFAFFHYPLYSDNAHEESDTYLQGSNSLEGLLKQHGVNLVFNGHAHLYQRNVVDGLTTYLVGASGVKLQRMDGGCSPWDAYALGWSNSQNRGYACGTAPVPASQSQVFSFVKVSVNGTTVTVSPINALGQVFDEQVYQFGAPFPTSTPTPTPTSTSSPESTATSTNTPEPTSTATLTPESTATSTNTPEPTATSTSTPESTATSTNTPEPTATVTSTPEQTATSTNTPDPTSTATSIPEPTATSTNTPEPTSTPTSTPESTPTATSAPAGPVTLLAQGSVWRYLDNGSNQGTAWRNAGFDDAGWSQGAAPLGYGDPMSTTINSGPSGARFITSYFRRTFDVTNPGQYGSVTLYVRRDDGAVVYLNGIEVARTNMPAGVVGYTTLAAATVDGVNETTFYSYTIPVSALTAGSNTLAVEVHQRAASSTDVSFDLRLVADFFNGSSSTSTPTSTPESAATATSTPGGPVTLVGQGSMWRYLDNGTNQGTAWRNAGFSDAGWSEGAAPLGYGDPMSTTINSGPSGARYITSYFRRTLDVVNPGQYGSVTLYVRRDDGAVVYLNGVEVARTNMPAGVVGYTTLAAATVDGVNETTFYSYTIPVGALTAGSNTLAVEVHQRAASSTDVSFDLRLVANP